MKKKKVTKKSIKMKGGSKADIFSYSGCKNNPESDGTWSEFGCASGNAMTGIGRVFQNMFGAIDNTIELGKIALD